MLRQAVVLDSEMTVREALERLAESGYWSDANAPEARQRLEAYLQNIRAAAAKGRKLKRTSTEQASVSGDAIGQKKPPNLTLADAARLLARPTSEVRVVIRRQSGVTIFWHVRSLEGVLDFLAGTARDGRLGDALHLAKFSSSPVIQLDELVEESSESFVGVVLNGHEAIGVNELLIKGELRGAGRYVRPDIFSEPTRSPASAEVGFKDARRPKTEGAQASDLEVRAYPILEAPQRVTINQRFDLHVGLSDAPVSGISSSEQLVMHARAGLREIQVEIQIVADGFAAPEGWRKTLLVTVENPTEARVTVPLVPLPQYEAVRLSLLCVHFIVEGITRGSASKQIVVESEPDRARAADARGISWLQGEGSPPVLSLATNGIRPDIELDIAKPDGNPARGSFRCTIRNSHGVPIPDGAFAIELGADANTFAKKLIEDIRQWSGDSIVDNLLENVAAIIAEKLPDEFWKILRAVAGKVEGRTLTFQLNSAEPYVPWELALVDPPLDSKRPRFLGAQVAMGRWILGDSHVASPPRHALSVGSLAVMAGMYNLSTGLRPLPQALEEAKTLAQSYSTLPTISLECTAVALKSLLDAALTSFDSVRGVDAVHFAGHGEVDPTRPWDAALYLSNGRPLSSILFRRSKLGQAHSPFIFLNACMVGSAGEILGDYGGFPGNCLAGGFCGLIAPLWAVNDEIAKSVALEFYRQVFEGAPDRSVAEIIRDLRANYKSDQPVPSYLAYVYYGNPHLRLTRVRGDTDHPTS